MANKVPKFTVSQKKTSRNAFDLSQTHLIQAAPGQLLPILSLDLIPEDDITINVVDFIKSMPIVSSPFSNAKGVYEFFFVPYHQLWHNFDQFITQMSDYRSTYFNLPNPPSSIPAFGRIKVGDVEPFFASPAFFQKKLSAFHDVFGHSTPPALSYLYDLLGYGPFCKEASDWNTSIGRSNCPDYQLNLFRLCAYQKIYQDYYRKTSYEPFDVSAYCLDNLQTSQYKSMFQPRYRNYGLDLLNNLRPSASLNVNNQKVFDNIIPQMFGTDTNIYQSNQAELSEGSSAYQGTPLTSNNKDGVAVGARAGSSSALSALNVNSIRAAFALDKLSQLMGRAEKDFKSQMQAVYGVNVSTGRDGKCIFIDGFSSDIQFSDIDNTNGSSYGGVNSQFSQYGKVASSGNGSIHFKAPEFGVLMCIYSIIPFVPYDSYRVDRFNTKHVYSDYFNPIYQRLGLQPLYMYELNTDYDESNDQIRPMIQALGWQPRYSEYKTAVDFNHGSFNSDCSLNSFSTSRNRNLAVGDKHDYLGSLTLRDFKINPNVFDSCFSVNYNGSLTTAPFFGKFSFNIVKVSSMDTDSLPLI